MNVKETLKKGIYRQQFGRYSGNYTKEGKLNREKYDKEMTETN